MRRLLLGFLFCSSGFAVTLLKVACGGPAGAGWVPDSPYVSGGSTQAVAGVTLLPYNFLRFSPPNIPIRYSFPSLAATSLTLFFVEPRGTQTAGSRVFSVTVNGVAVLPKLDLFASVGALVPTSYSFPVSASGAPLTIVIQSTSGNAVVSGILLEGEGPPQPSGLEADAPKFCPSVLFWYVTTDTKVVLWCSTALGPGWHEVQSIPQLIAPSVVCAIPERGAALDPGGRLVAMNRWTRTGGECYTYPHMLGNGIGIDGTWKSGWESQCRIAGSADRCELVR